MALGGNHVPERMFDSVGMTDDQLAGKACAVCDKRWPRPSVSVGIFPSGQYVYTCTDCVVAVSR